MTATVLTKRLAELKAAAADQTNAYESSRDKLYQNVVDAYLWWREAEANKAYLKSLYKEAGIRTRARDGNAPNFYPLVRLIWNIDISRKASTVSDWANSLLSLHEATNDPVLAESNDLRSDLIHMIHDVGGLSELRGEKRMKEAELFDEEDGFVLPERRGRKAGSTSKDTMLERKVSRAKAVEPKISIDVFPSAVADSNDLVVMLARRNRSTNKLEIVGSDYSETLIEEALRACTDIDRSSVSPSIRLIAEALQPHAIPPNLERYRKKFFDQNKKIERVQADGTSRKIYESTTVFVQPKTNEIIVTKTPKCVTCVTHVKPKSLRLHDGNALVLRGADRSWIEKELLNNQKLPLYDANPTDKLSANPSQSNSRFSLDLSSGAHNRTIYFYDTTEIPTDSVEAMTLDRKRKSKPSWEICANPQWMTEFDAECVSKWIKEIKSHFNKQRNRKIGISVDNEQVHLHWWWDDEQGKYLKSFSKNFNDDARLSVQSGLASIDLNPKDAMLLLSAVPKLPLSSHEIIMQAEQGSLYIEYETDLACFRSQLPPYDKYPASKAKGITPNKTPGAV